MFGIPAGAISIVILVAFICYVLNKPDDDGEYYDW
jgi:hypothetical protein